MFGVVASCSNSAAREPDADGAAEDADGRRRGASLADNPFQRQRRGDAIRVWQPVRHERRFERDQRRLGGKGARDLVAVLAPPFHRCSSLPYH